VYIKVAYDPASLRAYIECTQSIVEPVTRRLIDAVELSRLARATGGVPIRVSAEARAAMLERELLGEALERRAIDAAMNVMDLVEAGASMGDRGELVGRLMIELHLAMRDCHAVDQNAVTRVLRQCDARAAALGANGHCLTFLWLLNETLHER